MNLTDGSRQIFDEQTFKDGEYSKAEMHSKEFNDCTFIRCSFNEALFLACAFRNCQFKDCDLSLMNVKDSLFVGTKFEDCKVVGVNWAVARWTQAGLLDQVQPVLCFPRFAKRPGPQGDQVPASDRRFCFSRVRADRSSRTQRLLQ